MSGTNGGMKVLYLGDSDVCAFYRTLGPLLRMENVEVRRPTRYDNGKAVIDWSDFERCDLICMGRPASSSDLTMLRYAKAAGLPVWIDYDDYLLGLPMSNPAWLEYSAPDIQENVAEALSIATWVSVSTPVLGRALTTVCDRDYFVVKNAQMFPVAAGPGTSKSVIWRGSPTHAQDLQEYAQQIVEGLPVGWGIHAFGAMPWQLIPYMNAQVSLEFVPAAPILQYYSKLTQAQARIGVVPLSDTLFNRSKSNIAALEMLSAGTLPIVPDWHEWKDLGVPTYTPGTLGKVLRDACDRDTTDQWRSAAEAMSVTYSLEHMNNKRFAFLNVQ